MNDKLKADLNIAIMIVFMIGVAVFANFMGGTITGATIASECLLIHDCDDQNACTMDTCLGGKCLREPIYDCIDNDGCCPKGCNDSDC